jgi:hypothetical protein
VQDIRRGLRELLVDVDLRRGQGQLGVERAKRFSWDQTAAQVLGALEGACA